MIKHGGLLRNATKIHITQIQRLPGDGSGNDREVEEEDVEDPEKLSNHKTMNEEKIKQKTNSR